MTISEPLILPFTYIVCSDLNSWLDTDAFDTAEELAVVPDDPAEEPSALMPELAMEHTGYSKEETAVVGDRIYTDVKSGLNAGITGILVLSGETTLEILAASEDKPHLVLQDCSEILEALK